MKGMIIMYELINNIPLQVKEYNGQRVVTFKNIDTVHGRPEGTAKRNFNANKNYFIEGVDYFKVCEYEIRTHKIIDLSPKAHEDITLVTLSGYLMIVKSLTDDLSWNIQRLLVNSYFRVQELKTTYTDTLLQMYQEQSKKYDELLSRMEKLESKQTKPRKTKAIQTIPEEETSKDIALVLDFIDECCMRRGNTYNRDGITSKILYDYFVKWCYQEKNIIPPKKTEFVKGVCAFFGVSYKNKNKTRGRHYEGDRYYFITLRPEYINK